VNLNHESRGEGDQRYIVVSKKSKVAQELLLQEEEQ